MLKSSVFWQSGSLTYYAGVSVTNQSKGLLPYKLLQYAKWYQTNQNLPPTHAHGNNSSNVLFFYSPCNTSYFILYLTPITPPVTHQMNTSITPSDSTEAVDENHSSGSSDDEKSGSDDDA